ncbi:LacI family transcriptional regulator [Lipingzhangella halophila]|uniref:LacI family transcriptional regulator n=1 Tax=Lipingzhangella halophila TaxID=1783352 RepID=A0A7W7RD60_9ACTN|nr:LacI family DNA-binding transcriptional regulator [Lipingzhangella halophila]MBB4929794.1 LacI family transcriptional regulator [Lipingzhangella halophila]
MTDPAPEPPATRRPTMVDVAKAAGVSLKTVSRVANNVATVRPELAERVLRAMRDLGFQRNNAAANLRRGQETSTIGLIILDLANPFYSTIAAAAAEVTQRHNTQLITASSGWNPDRERELVLDLCERRVDALIIVPTGDDQSYLRAEIDRGTPVVFIDRPPAGLDGDTVLIDNRNGARELVRRLINEGHRGIGVITDSLNSYTMGERVAGVSEELAAAGIAEQAHFTEVYSDKPETAADAVGRMLDAPDPPSAVFCGNNRILTGALEELVARRSRVRLAGFDDFEFAHLLPYPVTVVGYDTRALGRLAAELTFQRIRTSTPPLTNYVVPTYLVDRGVDLGTRQPAPRVAQG